MENPHEFVGSAYARLCAVCGREVNDYEYHFTPERIEEIRNYGHVFTYRSDYDQCSVCNGTHGRDDHAEITRLKAEVKRLREFEAMYKGLCK